MTFISLSYKVKFNVTQKWFRSQIKHRSTWLYYKCSQFKGTLGVQGRGARLLRKYVYVYQFI